MSNRSHLGNTDVDAAATLPFSQACENNKAAILTVLQKELLKSQHVIEIGSGTGQHSVFFAPNLPKLIWQTSDVHDNLPAILAWQRAYPSANLPAPLVFDLTKMEALPKPLVTALPYDAIFTANTLHIIAWPLVEKLIEMASKDLPNQGKLIIYGAFNDNGAYTSVSNEQFDALLKSRDQKSGIRDKAQVIAAANAYQFDICADYEMPAHNRLLVFQKRR